jgi:hypothetical protein
VNGRLIDMEPRAGEIDPLRAASATGRCDAVGNAKLSAASKMPKEDGTKARQTRTLDNPRLVIFSHCDPGGVMAPFYTRAQIEQIDNKATARVIRSAKARAGFFFMRQLFNSPARAKSLRLD